MLKLEKDMVKIPKGFIFEGFHSGIKKDSLDTALIASSIDATAAGMFTTNKIPASCVSRNKELLDKGHKVRGVIVNSGNANACTGPEGDQKNIHMAEYAAELIDARPEEMLTASTGVIGVDLPVEKIKKTLENMKFPMETSQDCFLRSCKAILTTDTYEKKASVSLSVDGKECIISGMAKGSGMIHPNMATMLSFITTDIKISSDMLSLALQETVNETFNMISVDGDTSTNDMVLLFANGLAGNKMIREKSTSYNLFIKGLRMLARYLAKSIAADGEGATKLLEVEVTGAKSKTDAQKIAKTVISSNLVKTAFFGMDPNWGRILAAIGSSGADFDPEGISIYFQGAPGYSCLMSKGKPHHFDMDSVRGILKEKNIFITIALSDGDASATAWGCDLSYDYVKINAEYTT